jgi:hypothetical protein
VLAFERQRSFTNKVPNKGFLLAAGASRNSHFIRLFTSESDWRAELDEPR